MSESVSRHGAFDGAHDWTGDELIAPEAAAFQEGKAKALKKLLPFAHPASQQEAAAVVLELDGSEFDFRVGERFEVTILVPANRSVAHLHTHFSDEPPSDVDWANFLTTPAVVQSHVVCPNVTYSLHKPPGWKVPPDLDTSLKAKNAWVDAYESLDRELRDRNHTLSELEFDEAATRKLAERSGILFRIGARRGA